ncbi:ORF6N domain-containing protein [Actimicrobium antarcticum]|uniref:KilA-N DNA-binding domain-containing protein n=1 Tax=Actimicrobium antarcticum TaxID=1051899 RepID=A0ABP7TIJ7_9BURK
MFESDLSQLYRVSTKRLNEQVKRSSERLSPHFVFILSAQEKAEVVTHRDELGKLKFSKSLQFAFTEQGAIDVATNCPGTSTKPACSRRLRAANKA